MEAHSGKTELSASTALTPVSNGGGVRIVAATHPFKVAERIDMTMYEGKTLAEMLEIAQPDPVLRSHAHISINDIKIPKHNWHLVRPKNGTTVTIRVVAQGGGGGGKNPLRTILSIAIIVAAIYLGPQIGAALYGIQASAAATTVVIGSTITAAQVGGAIVSIVGSLLVNALAPIRPPKMQALSRNSSAAESPTLSITGARNQANVYGPVPVVLGRHKMAPPYGALPFTEIVGSDQYVRMVFVWGKGPLLIEDLKIGETPIENFADVEYINRSGFPNDPLLSIYTNDVYEEGLSVLMTKDTGYVTRNSQANADEIALDFMFARGLTVFDGSGNRTNRTVEFDVEYAPVGSSNWVGGGGALSSTSSPSMPAESATTKVLKPGVTAEYATARIAAGDSESLYYSYVTADNPHRYDLVVADRWSGAISVIRGNTALGSSTAVAPTWPTTVFPLAKIYRDTDAVIVAGDITDMRTSVTGWGSGLAVSDNGTDTVSVASGTLASTRQSVTNATSEAIRHTVRFKVPSRGQWQVRTRRYTDDATDDSTFDEITWAVLRTVTYEPPFDCNGLATTEVRIKATDQLNQVVDQLNGIVTSILPDYDYVTEEWVTRPTQNPASLVRAVFQGPGNARGLADSRLDIAGLEDFHDYCRENDFRFNMVRDFVSSVYDTVADVCASAFAAPCQVDGKWGVVIDRDKTLPITHFTPRNSYDFSFERMYPERPHGWRIRFVNEDNNFRQDERIVYDDGYDETNADQFESLELPGITDPDLVYKIGRRRIAEARLRPEKYIFSADIEQLVCTRGDLILITHDAISVGLASGRVKELVLNGEDDVVGLVIDNPVDMQLGVTYGITLRTVNGRIQRGVVTENGEGISTITLATPIASESAPDVGDIFGFGEMGSETLEALVTNIVPGQNLAATITAIPLAREIFDAYTGPIPEFNPHITVEAGTVVPFITLMRSDESVLFYQPNGMLSPSIRITFGRFSSSIIDRANGVEIQYREVGEAVFRSMFLVKQEVLEVDLVDVQQGLTYEIKVRYTYANKSGEFSPVYTHTVIGMATPPADVSGLVVEGDYLRWTYVKPIDFAGFAVFYSNDTTATLGSMLPAHQGIITDTQFNITNFRRGEKKFAVIAVDIAGNESNNPATIIKDFNPVPIQYIQHIYDFDGDEFPGTITNGSVSFGELVADDTSLYLPNDTDLYLPVDGDDYLVSQYLELTYVTDPIEIPDNYLPGRMLMRETVSSGVQILYRNGVDDLFAMPDDELFCGDDDLFFCDYTWATEYRDFPEYVDLYEGDVYQFKVIGTAGEVRSSVSNFDVIIDAEYQNEYFSGVLLDALGSRIPLTKTYKSVIMVNPNLRTGGTATTTKTLDLDETLGPLLQAFDSGGSGVAATVDGIIHGVKG